jgi:hypothetical protein
MPFLMDANDFARKAVDLILAGVRYRTIPWQMGCVSARCSRLCRGGSSTG